MSKNKGTLISSPIRPLSSGMNIPTAYSNEILGGLHSVASIGDRDLITFERRMFGMLVYVTGADEFYQLKQISSPDLSDNSNWDLIDFTGNLSDWVDSVISITSSIPATYSVGDRYMVFSGTGSWFGLDDTIVEWNGVWSVSTPMQGTSVRIDNVVDSIYCYLYDDYPSGAWIKQSFVSDPYRLKYNIPSIDIINIGTSSEYLLYGDLRVDGQINNWGKLVLINGTISGSGSISIYGSGSIYTPYFLTDVIGGTGISISNVSNTGRKVSLDVIAGTGISIGSSGSRTIISSLLSESSISPRYLIGASESVTVPDYREYFIYGDLDVRGLLDIGTYGKVVVANGSLIAASGSTINNVGNVEVYDLLTTSDNNIKVGVTEVKYGTSGRILYENGPVYIPVIGTYGNVATESNNLVYATSSSYLTSTSSNILQPYMGIGVSNPLKKLHINGSGILISGTESEQSSLMGDPNWSRFVIDSNIASTQSLVDIRNSLGRVLTVNGAFRGSNKYPGVSIGTVSNNGLFTVSGYTSSNYFNVGYTGSVSFGTVSNNDSNDNILVWNSSTTNIEYRNKSSITPKIKSGVVSGLNFAPAPMNKVTITFSTPYTTEYSVCVTGEISRSWFIQSKTFSSFVINAILAATFSENVFWQTISYGEN